MKIASAAGMTRVVENFVLSGAYIVQPVSTPPVSSAYSVNQPADDVDVPAQQVQLRKREILRADLQRHEEVAENRPGSPESGRRTP